MRHKKILIVLMNLILILFVISNTVLASGLIDTFDKSISTSGNGAETIKDKGGRIVGIIQYLDFQILHKLYIIGQKKYRKE